MHKPLLTSKHVMLERMVAVRGGSEVATLVYNIAVNRTITKFQPSVVRREFERAMGFDCMAELPADCELPWDRYVVYNRRMMEKLYRNMERKLGGSDDLDEGDRSKAR
jgi:hypothetical protein